MQVVFTRQLLLTGVDVGGIDMQGYTTGKHAKTIVTGVNWGSHSQSPMCAGRGLALRLHTPSTFDPRAAVRDSAHCSAGAVEERALMNDGGVAAGNCDYRWAIILRNAVTPSSSAGFVARNSSPY